MGLNRAIDEAEKNFDALVIWHEAPFAVGANLKAALESLKAGQFDEFEKMVALFQQTSQRLKYAWCRRSPRSRAWRSAAAASS